MNAEAHALLADQLTGQGKIDEAITHYEQAVRIFPQGELLHRHFAIALAQAGRHDRAVVEWREAIRLIPPDLSQINPDRADFLFAHGRIGLADALLATGDTREAVARCREVLKMNPNAIEALIILGQALAAEGQVEEALPYLKRAVELEPGNARAHFHLGLTLYDRGQSQSAIAHLNEAIRLQPDSVAMLWQSAWILATSPDASVRDGARAVGLARRAIKRSGAQEVRAFDALAAALAETEKFSAAVDAAEQASTIALTRNDETLADAIDQRTRLYRQGLPYRERHATPASSPGPD